MPWNMKKAIEHHRKAVAHRTSTGDCATFTRDAIEQGLGQCMPRPAPVLGRRVAKDYGVSLQAVGFSPLPGMCGGFEAGDVVIVEGFPGHEDGHMAMFDGKQWNSDFPQNNYNGREGGLYPGPAWNKSRPAYRLYRRVDR